MNKTLEFRIEVYRAPRPGVARLVASGDGHDIAHWRTDVHESGAWIVHCPLCKDRVQHASYNEALAYADSGHEHWPAHQRWLGRLALGLELPDRRGYDNPSSLQCRHNNQFIRCNYTGAELWRIADGDGAQVEEERRAREFRRVAAARDEMTVRRAPVPPPTPRWSTGAPLGAVTVTWSDGRFSSGTRYGLYANDRRVAEVVALREGGWLFNGQHVPDDSALIRAVA